MKAAVFTEPGSPDVLHIEDVADPVPGDGELLIQVEAISLEGGDLLHRSGRLPMPPGAANETIIGYSAAGEVAALGEGVSGFTVGQKVTTFHSYGSHGALRVAPAATSFVVPDGVDLHTAAIIPVGPGTAAWALDVGMLQPNETVLVVGATGGVGSAAVQLAARAGARVIGTASNAESLEGLRALGLSDAVVSTGEGSFGAEVRTLLGGPHVDLIIDTVGGFALVDAMETLRDAGRVVLVGSLGHSDAKLDPFQVLIHQHSVIGCVLGPRMGEPRVRALIEDLLTSAAHGGLKTPIDAVYPFDQVVAAHRHAETRGRLGRVIVSL